MNTKELSLVAIYAALYAALVIVFSPISFGVLQFRIAGILRPGIAKSRLLAVGYALGVIVGNLLSPYAGIYELAFMPVASLVAGILGYEAARRIGGGYWTCGLMIGVLIPISVSWMLLQLFGLPMLLSLPGLIASEMVINFIGAGIFSMLDKRVRWYP